MAKGTRQRKTAPKDTSPSRAHARTRAAHSVEIAEDYVEAIADSIASRGVARVADLVRHFGVSHVTVSRTVGRLQRDGLVKTEPHRPIELTATGRAMADRSRKRHEVVLAFLRALGVDEATARADAEGIEHHVSRKTLAAFERFAARAR